MSGQRCFRAPAGPLPVLALVLALACGPGRARGPEVGGLYSVVDGPGFRVAKVLVVEPGAVHVRLYKERWAGRPESVEARDLSLGKVDDPDGFGMGHLPLSPPRFQEWQPMLVGRDPVRPEELEGYQVWKESHGGVF